MTDVHQETQKDCNGSPVPQDDASHVADLPDRYRKVMTPFIFLLSTAFMTTMCVVIILPSYFWGRHVHPIILDGSHTTSVSYNNNFNALEGDNRYLVGVGKADITGPIVDINLMGYADPMQIGSGLQQRLYSRAFIVGSITNPLDRWIYLVLDIHSGDTAIRYGVLSGLQTLGPKYAMYGHDNLALTGTHSHAGPAAWLNYLLPQITSYGFDKQSYRAIVDGTLLSIRRAHESLEPGHLSVGAAKIAGASINRSLFSYFQNPDNERARYNISVEDDGSVEMNMTMLKMQRNSDGKNIGVLTWFPTHGTSMLGNNTIISGDNKGVAADLLEKQLRGSRSAADDFVAGFSQANMGDVSPNVLGAWCEDSVGQRCSLRSSTCSDGTGKQCHARGPGFRENDNGAASCYEIGKRQSDGALALYESLDKEPPNLEGTIVKAVHKFHDMADFEFMLPNGSLAHTCPAALGYSFLAGTTDGPGLPDFTQHGSNSSNAPLTWNVLSAILNRPSQRQISCQYPKPILLDIGEVHKPYQWVPNIVDVQTLRVGHLFIIVSPGEATTMAGRRWKEAIARQSGQLFRKELGGNEPVVVIGGPSNTYTHYITTEQEYMVQRFEGASTLYGPHTLAAHINRSLDLLPYLGAGDDPARPDSDLGPLPPDNSERSWSFITGVVYDGTPWFQRFGEVISNVKRKQFGKGDSVVSTFVGANPRNNLRLEGTYAAVEFRQDAGNQWKVVRDDSDWDLVFHWRRINKLRGTSEAEVVWDINEAAAPGEYRLRYFGDSKSILGSVTAFEGASDVFRVAGGK